MDWKTASAYYAQRLEQALAVQRYALSLARLPQVQNLGVKPETLQILKEEAEQADRQKKRLEKGEFRIAVVGLEKSWKKYLRQCLVRLRPPPSQITTLHIYHHTDLLSSARIRTTPRNQSKNPLPI